MHIPQKFTYHKRRNWGMAMAEWTSAERSRNKSSTRNEERKKERERERERERGRAENAVSRARNEFRCARHYAGSAERFVIAVVEFALSVILPCASTTFSRVDCHSGKMLRKGVVWCRNKKIYSRFCLTGAMISLRSRRGKRSCFAWLSRSSAKRRNVPL